MINDSSIENIIKINGFSFCYPGSDYLALDNINIEIPYGEFVVLCGKSGCGKSTLLRSIKTAIAPFGKRVGEILFDGKSVTTLSQREECSNIGFVLQEPDAQIVTDKVWHELAFGLESLGMSAPEIREKVAEMSTFFGIQNWFHKNVSELSGGQKQLLNLASVMVMEPKLLILDEPTSLLDPISAQDFLTLLSRLNKELGVTIILSEHRLEDAIPLCDRVIVMEDGKIVANGKPSVAGQELLKNNSDMFIAMPTVMRVCASVEKDSICPVTVKDGREWLVNYVKNNGFVPVSHMAYENDGEVAVELKNIWFTYDAELPYVIRGLSAKIKKGEIYAILGGNGSGKTTALSVIAGLRRAQRGRVIFNDCAKRIGVLPQNPQVLFTENTVAEDLRAVSKTEAEVKEVAELCAVSDFLNRHPYDLSGGEQQRLALAKVLLTKPQILLLDEPTKSLDAHFKRTFADILQTLKAQGACIIMVSHDTEFCAEFADRCAMFFDGQIVSENTPRAFFAGKSFYTTAAGRIARGIIEGAILDKDIVCALGGQIYTPPSETSGKRPYLDNTLGEPSLKREKKHKISAYGIISLLFILCAVPLTIFIGMYAFDDRKYYFVSTIIMIEAFLLFVLSYSHKKPRAREIVIISVMCAIAVAGRTAFYMVPHFKPTVALIIISGVALGADKGFLIGTVSGFISNFFYGQGPWTPWQMFALGLAGFIGGLIFHNSDKENNRLLLCTFGAFATIIIYGGIMNVASVLIYHPVPTQQMILAALATGLPFDLIHAFSTVFFLFVGAKPMMSKLSRIKVKYGVFEDL